MNEIFLEGKEIVREEEGFIGINIFLVVIGLNEVLILFFPVTLLSLLSDLRLPFIRATEMRQNFKVL